MNGKQKSNIIELSNISKKYPISRLSDKSTGTHPGDFWALRDISISVKHGEILGILGRNGAGKTTLLNIIAGVLSPTDGDIAVQGKTLGLFNLGVGFQDELTGKENIFLNGAILGASRKELDSKLQEIIDFSELGNFITMPLGTYSQGMRLRLGFSIIANLDFDTLLIDEVLAVGDTLFQNKCFERLTSFKQANNSLVITTQDLNLIERLSDKVVLLEHGSVVFEGSPVEGINRYQALLNKEKFYVGAKPDTLVANTKKWADPPGIRGTKLGTGEAIIDSVKMIDKTDLACRKVKSGDSLEIKVNFTVKSQIKEPHFGVAIFREDGVYCYGPNSLNDGNDISYIPPGEYWFKLKYKTLLLAPGEYTVSVAIWDKNETLAFAHHNAFYRLTITGYKNQTGELLNIPAEYSDSVPANSQVIPSPDIVSKSWGQKKSSGDIAISAMEIKDSFGKTKDTFKTGDCVKIDILFSSLPEQKENLQVWLGIYRDDETYCQGFYSELKSNEFIIEFPNLPLLPGKYRFSVGVWDRSENKFLLCNHAVYPLTMFFDKADHGTVFLKHEWSWNV